MPRGDPGYQARYEKARCAVDEAFAERKRERARKYYHRDIEKSRKANREKAAKVRYQKYGMTLEDYRIMWELQKGVCYLCGGLSLDGSALAVDHDHKTGRIRKLLCAQCNTALGGFKDDPLLLRRAATYIESFEGVE